MIKEATSTFFVDAGCPDVHSLRKATAYPSAISQTKRFVDSENRGAVTR